MIPLFIITTQDLKWELNISTLIKKSTTEDVLPEAVIGYKPSLQYLYTTRTLKVSKKGVPLWQKGCGPLKPKALIAKTAFLFLPSAFGPIHKRKDSH